MMIREGWQHLNIDGAPMGNGCQPPTIGGDMLFTCVVGLLLFALFITIVYALSLIIDTMYGVSDD